MSRILGKAIHQAYVFPDFEAALARFAAGGIGPFFVMESTNGIGLYRGEEHPLSMSIAFFYTGDTCIEIIVPHGPQQSAYGEFLDRNPDGGLHHIAYCSDDFAKTLKAMESAGKPLQIVQEFRNPTSGETMEVYCEPVGANNPILFQFVLPGLFDSWFDAMHEIAANWDGSDPFRDARPLLAAAMSQNAA